MTYFRSVSNCLSVLIVFLFLLGFDSLVWSQQCPAPPPATPSLSAVAGPDFNYITLSWTGVSGSNGVYYIFGRPQNGSWGDPMSASVGEGQTFSQAFNNYGIIAPMRTNTIYEFKVETYNGCGQSAESNIASARTLILRPRCLPQLS